MCIKSKKGFKLNQLKGLVNKFEYFFGEDQARYLIEISKENLSKVDKMTKYFSVYLAERNIRSNWEKSWGRSASKFDWSRAFDDDAEFETRR